MIILAFAFVWIGSQEVVLLVIATMTVCEISNNAIHEMAKNTRTSCILYCECNSTIHVNIYNYPEVKACGA
jgi:hypothetical protein